MWGDWELHCTGGLGAPSRGGKGTPSRGGTGRSIMRGDQALIEPMDPMSLRLGWWGFTSAAGSSGLLSVANDRALLMIDVLVFLGRCFLLKGIQPWVTDRTRNSRKGELEGTVKGNLIYPLPQGRINYSYIISDRYLSALLLKASSDGDPTASLGRLSRGSNSPYY